MCSFFFPIMYESRGSLWNGIYFLTAGSKAAHLGLRKGKALLSVWSSLSPQTSTKEALTTFKSWGTSAATNFTKKYVNILKCCTGC
jgi:hypothetical protein